MVGKLIVKGVACVVVFGAGVVVGTTCRRKIDKASRYVGDRLTAAAEALQEVKEDLKRRMKPAADSNLVAVDSTSTNGE